MAHGHSRSQCHQCTTITCGHQSTASDEKPGPRGTTSSAGPCLAHLALQPLALPGGVASRYFPNDLESGAFSTTRQPRQASVYQEPLGSKGKYGGQKAPAWPQTVHKDTFPVLSAPQASGPAPLTFPGPHPLTFSNQLDQVGGWEM